MAVPAESQAAGLSLVRRRYLALAGHEVFLSQPVSQQTFSSMSSNKARARIPWWTWEGLCSGCADATAWRKGYVVGLFSLNLYSLADAILQFRYHLNFKLLNLSLCSFSVQAGLLDGADGACTPWDVIDPQAPFLHSRGTCGGQGQA